MEAGSGPGGCGNRKRRSGAADKAWAGCAQRGVPWAVAGNAGGSEGDAHDRLRSRSARSARGGRDSTEPPPPQYCPSYGYLHCPQPAGIQSSTLARAVWGSLERLVLTTFFSHLVNCFHGANKTGVEVRDICVPLFSMGPILFF
jgi:hypothetical protein